MYQFRQRAFTAGQLDLGLFGRQDLAKYFQSASVIENLNISRQGHVSKRRGTDLMASLDGILGVDAAGKARALGKVRLLPFEHGESGDYLVLTGGHAFVANKDGVLLCSGDRTRKVDSYAAYEENGVEAVYSGTDTRASDATPVDVIHPDGTGTYATTRYATLLAAAAAAVAGDTIRLHGDIVLTGKTSFSFAVAGTITLDLYGHTITCGIPGTDAIGGQADIYVNSSATTLEVVNSWNTAATLEVVGSGGNPIGILVNLGSLVIGPRVRMVQMTSGVCVKSIFGTSVTINGGTFIQRGEQGYTTGCVHVQGSAVINGGTFSSAIDCPALVGGVHNNGEHPSITINDGDFSNSGGGAAISAPAAIPLIINNGRFRTNGSVIAYTPFYKTWSGTVWFNVRRGLFSNTKVCYIAGGATNDISTMMADGSVKFDAYPGTDGLYGIKVSGESDFTWDEDHVRAATDYDARPFRVAIPYADADLAKLRYFQSGDTIFVTHRSYAPASFVRDNDTGRFSWASLTFDCSGGYRPPVVSSVSGTGFATDATSYPTTRTIQYAATYVKNGSESPLSSPVSFTYRLPWPNNAAVNVSVNRGANAEAPDYFNIYKNQGSGWGLIGSTDSGKPLGGLSGSLNTETLYVPVGSGVYKCCYDVDAAAGRTDADTLRLLQGETRSTVSAAVGSDFALVSLPGKTIDISFPAAQKQVLYGIRLWLNARDYDPSDKVSWCALSSGICKATFTCVIGHTSGTTDHPDGETVQIVGGGAQDGGLSVNLASTGFGTSYVGARAEYLRLQRRTCSLGASGQVVTEGLVGDGAKAKWFNDYPSPRLFQITNDLLKALATSTSDTVSLKYVTKVSISFPSNANSDYLNGAAGVVQALRFYGKSILAAESDESTIQDDYITPDYSITPPGEAAPFSQAGDYPASVAIFGQRLCFASTDNNPFTFWMSCVGDLYNFSTHDTPQENDAIEASLAATRHQVINAMMPGTNLLLFCTGSEWLVAPVSGNTLSYKTVSAKQQSEIGCADWVLPCRVGNDIVFVEANGRTCRAIRYAWASDTYESTDLSVLSESLFRETPIVQACYRQHPESEIVCALADGSLASMVLMRDQEVTAWAHHTLGGGWLAVDCAANGGRSNGSSDVALVVAKDGSFALWRLRDRVSGTDFASRVCLDGTLVFDGADKASVTVPASAVVVDLSTGAEVSLADCVTGTSYVTGYVFTSELTTVYPEAQGVDMTLQLRYKDLKSVDFRLLESSDFYMIPTGIRDQLETYGQIVKADASVTGGVLSSFTGDLSAVPPTSTNSIDGRLTLLHTGYLPWCLLSIALNYSYDPDIGGQG